jgi:hypothetical protein
MSRVNSYKPAPTILVMFCVVVKPCWLVCRDVSCFVSSHLAGAFSAHVSDCDLPDS